MKIISIFVIFIFFISCTSDKQADVTSIEKNKIIPPVAKQNTNSNKNKIALGSHWSAYGDTSNYLTGITFHEQYAVYWYHEQCQYYYFTNNIQDTIKLVWSYKTDCLLTMNMLEKSYGLKKYPKKGNSFCSYNLINDSTLKVIYYFPEWTKKLMKSRKTLFFLTILKKKCNVIKT